MFSYLAIFHLKMVKRCIGTVGEQMDTVYGFGVGLERLSMARENRLIS